jgi:hypothetical protein
MSFVYFNHYVFREETERQKMRFTYRGNVVAKIKLFQFPGDSVKRMRRSIKLVVPLYIYFHVEIHL